MNQSVLESVERLQMHQLIDVGCKHIWNAHRQCQWCHGTQRDYDVIVVVTAYLNSMTEIARLQKENDKLFDSLPLLDNRTKNEARKLLNESYRFKAIDGVERSFVSLELAKEVIESLLAENSQLKNDEKYM